MSLSFIQQPNNLEVHTAYDSISYELLSTTSGITRVIANVIDVRDSDNILASVDRDPEIGTSNRFVFDIQEMTQNSMSVDLPAYDSGNQFDPVNSSKQYRVEFYEVVEDSSGLLQTNWTEDGSAAADLTSSEITVHNAAFSFQEMIELNWSDYNNNVGGGAKKFMTDQPVIVDIELNDNSFLAVSSAQGVVSPVVLNVKTYGSSGLIDDAYIDMDLSDEKEGCIIGVGPKNINNTTFATSSATINSDVTSYTVQFMANTGGGYNSLSLLMIYQIKDLCVKNKTRFFWMNKFGKIDSYSFDSKKVSTQNASRETYEKSLSLTPSLSDRRTTTLSTESNEEFTAYSRHIGREKMNWLRQILKSPAVFIDNGSGFVAVQLLDFNFTYDDTENNVSQLVIDYVLSNKDQIQKG